MGRKPKFDKATKVKACKDYIKGIGSYESIAKSLNVDRATILDWHTKFVIHGETIFETSNTNNSHSKEFKLSVINDYISGKTSMRDAAAKYNIAHGMISNWL